MYSKKLVTGLLLILFSLSNISAQNIDTGVKLIRNEKYSEAKKYFQSLLSSPLKAEAYFYLGEIYCIHEKLDSAKKSYEKGIEYNNEFALNYAGLVKLNLLSANYSEAEKNQNNAIELADDKDSKVYIVLAEAHSKIQKYSVAIDLLNTPLSNGIYEPNIYISLGKVYIDKINGTEAIKNFQEALNIDPSNPEAMTQKAKVYSLINNYDGAVYLLIEAITNDSTYSPAYRELAEVYATKKDYSKASEFYSKYIEKSEVTIEKQKRYASILYLNKEYDKAINIAKEVTAIEPVNIIAIRIVAYSYYKLEDTENGQLYFQKLFEIPSAEFLTSDYENYADLLGKTGNDSLSLEYLQKVTELDSSRKDIYGKMSIIYFKNKNWNGVISSLESKKDLTAQEYFDLGKAYYFVGEKAITEVTQNISNTLSLEWDQESEVRLVLLHYQKDVTYANNDIQKIDAAAGMVNQKIESILSSTQKTNWTSAKDQWWEVVRKKIQQDYAKADSAFKILITKVPDLAIAHFWQARVKSNFDPESDSGLAKPFYEQFLSLSKEDTTKFKKELIEAYSYLGYYYYLKEDNANSKLYWQKVLAIDPNNNQAIEAVKNL